MPATRPARRAGASLAGRVDGAGYPGWCDRRVASAGARAMTCLELPSDLLSRVRAALALRRRRGGVRRRRRRTCRPEVLHRLIAWRARRRGDLAAARHHADCSAALRGRG